MCHENFHNFSLSRLEHILFLQFSFASYFRKRLSKENFLVCHYLKSRLHSSNFSVSMAISPGEPGSPGSSSVNFVHFFWKGPLVVSGTVFQWSADRMQYCHASGSSSNCVSVQRYLGWVEGETAFSVQLISLYVNRFQHGCLLRLAVTCAHHLDAYHSLHQHHQQQHQQQHCLNHRPSANWRECQTYRQRLI